MKNEVQFAIDKANKKIEIIKKVNKAIVALHKTMPAVLWHISTAALLAKSAYDLALLDNPDLDQETFLIKFREAIENEK